MAHAWVEAEVHTATAHVDIGSEATAIVAMELGVRVRGGWLESLEIAGLDPDLQLDEHSVPTVTSMEDQARKVRPRVRIREGGTIILSFARGDRLERGSYRITFVYTTGVAEHVTRLPDPTRVRFAWTMPGWRTGLDDVTIHVTAGVLSRAVQSDSEAGIEGVSGGRFGSRSTWTFLRPHLPRTVDWTIAIDVPMTDLSPLATEQLLTDQGSEQVDPKTPPRRPFVDARKGGFEALLAALALIALCKLGLFHRACVRSGSIERPLVALPLWSRTVGIASLGTVAVWQASERPEIALGCAALGVLLQVQRPARPIAEARLGFFRPVEPADLAAARWSVWRERFSGLALVDGFAPGGLLLGVALCGGIGWIVADSATQAVLSTIVAVLLLTSGRYQLPQSVARNLLLLSKVAEKEISEHPPELVLHVEPTFHWQEARLRVLPADHVTGLFRLDVVVVQSRHTTGFSLESAVLAVTRTGSITDRQLGSVLERAVVTQHASGRRTARLVMLAGFSDAEIAAKLAACVRACGSEAPESMPSQAVA